MRKQRRMAELQDHQDRVRMGLIPPDAPKGTCLAPLPAPTVPLPDPGLPSA